MRPKRPSAALMINAYMRRVTIGYHRLHSHKAFRATTATRMVLALLGASALQGSIRVRVCVVSG